MARESFPITHTDKDRSQVPRAIPTASDRDDLDLPGQLSPQDVAPIFLLQ